MIYNNILETIGDTPLISLNRVGKNLPFKIYVKVEYFNPGSSIKDRIAIKMVEEAEKRGDLKPGGTIVEATSGNTGMGLALVAAVKGYNAVFVMPDKMSLEKIQALRAFGAKVVVTPTNVEPEDPRSYYCVSRRIAEETPNAFYANQYHNPDNPLTHYETTGPEIWEQTEGKITHFIAGLGTGGTISGVARYLKEKNPQIKIVGVDPEGSVYTDLIRTGKMGKAHPYKVEGVGEDFLPSTINIDIIDECYQVSDKESFQMTRKLAKTEGLFTGGSCGFAVAGALQWAAAYGKKDAFPVVLLPDSGSRYLSKVYNDDWMRENSFLEEPQIFVDDFFEAQSLHSASLEDSLKSCIERMREHKISQLPVLGDDGKLAGIIDEYDLLRALSDQPDRAKQNIGDLVSREVKTVSLKTSLHEVQELLRQDLVPVVIDSNKVLGVITKIDLLNFLVHREKSS